MRWQNAFFSHWIYLVGHIAQSQYTERHALQASLPGALQSCEPRGGAAFTERGRARGHRTFRGAFRGGRRARQTGAPPEAPKGRCPPAERDQAALYYELVS